MWRRKKIGRESSLYYIRMKIDWWYCSICLGNWFTSIPFQSWEEIEFVSLGNIPPISVHFFSSFSPVEEMFPFEFVPPIYFHFPQYKHSINEIILVSFPFLQNQWWYWTKNLILLMPSFVSITWCLNFPCPFQSESWMFRGSYLFGSKFWVFSVESFCKAIGFNNCGQYPAKVIWLRYALPMISFFLGCS